MFWGQHQYFYLSKKTIYKTPSFGEMGVATKGCFVNNLCFANCEKLSFFVGPIFGGKFWSTFKNTVKRGVSAHC